jgi:rod shape-determining protein MreB
MEVKGRDSVAGLPKTIHITSQEIREALADTIGAIVDAVRAALERCPPELSADLVDRGFVMAGGGALIRGIDKFLSDRVRRNGTGLTRPPSFKVEPTTRQTT